MNEHKLYSFRALKKNICRHPFSLFIFVFFDHKAPILGSMNAQGWLIISANLSHHLFSICRKYFFDQIRQGVQLYKRLGICYELGNSQSERYFVQVSQDNAIQQQARITNEKQALRPFFQDTSSKPSCFRSWTKNHRLLVT